MPLGTKVGLCPGHIVLHGDPAPTKRGTTSNFRPMSIAAKRSPISATAEHLFVAVLRSDAMTVARLQRIYLVIGCVICNHCTLSCICMHTADYVISTNQIFGNNSGNP